MNKRTKHIKNSGWLFLIVYLFLLGLSTLHYHHYEFDNCNLLKKSESRSIPANDIIQDFTGSCIIQYYANTFINNFHSASEILNSKLVFSEYVHLYNFFTPSNDQYSSLTLRAPPVVI